MPPTPKKAKYTTIRVKLETHSRFMEYKRREAWKSAEELFTKMLDVYDVYKGKTLRIAIEKSPHVVVKELNTLEDDLVDAVNGLRKTYETDAEWKKDFPRLISFGDALKFDWAKAQVQQSQRLKPYPHLSKLLKLRLKWIELILNIVWEIERITKLAEEKTFPSQIIDEILGDR